MVIDFSKGPSLAELYPTVICWDAPGSIGCLLHSGVVQPHDACTFSKISGVFPVLTTSKICVTGLP